MKKNKVIFLPVLIMMSLIGLYNQANAQCCNVFASNGTAVTTSDGTCATLAYPTTACEEIVLIEIITVDVWVFYDEAFADVRFATASDELNGNATRSLDKIANAMNNGKHKLKISGYADSTGTEEFNKELSAKRAVAVKKYLMDHGVSPEKISLAAYGERMPKAPNRTKRGRAANRRVEFDLYY